MGDFRSQFRDSRWSAREENLIEKRGHACEECDATEADISTRGKHLRAYNSYWEPGIPVWGFHDSDYRVLCPECYDIRRDTEQLIRRLLRRGTNAEQDALCRALERLANMPAADRGRAFEVIACGAHELSKLTGQR